MSISQFFLAADFFGIRYVNGLMIWKRALYFYYTRAEIGSTHRSIVFFRLFTASSGLSIRRNESGLIKPATLPVLVSIRRKMAGGHSKESIGYLIVDRFWFIRNQVSNHRRGKRKEKRDRTLDGKDYFALRYCVPIIGRTPRKVAYIVAFSRCEQRNKIRSFLSSKKTWHERIDSSNYAMCLEKSCCHRAFPIYIYIDETLRCWWKLRCVSFFCHLSIRRKSWYDMYNSRSERLWFIASFYRKSVINCRNLKILRKEEKELFIVFIYY